MINLYNSYTIVLLFLKTEKLYRNKMCENAKYYIVRIYPSPNFVFPTKYFTDYSERNYYIL